MRAKFIYEKFAEDSDPIHDLGIGHTKNWDNIGHGDVLQVKKYINSSHPIHSYVILYSVNRNLYGEIKMLHYIYAKDKKELHNVLTSRSTYDSGYGWQVSQDFLLNYLRVVQPWELKNLITEKFELESDPIQDLRIGVFSKFKELATKYGFRQAKTFKTLQDYYDKYYRGDNQIIIDAAFNAYHSNKQIIIYHTTNDPSFYVLYSDKQNGDFRDSGLEEWEDEGRTWLWYFSRRSVTKF